MQKWNESFSRKSKYEAICVCVCEAPQGFLEEIFDNANTLLLVLSSSSEVYIYST